MFANSAIVVFGALMQVILMIYNFLGKFYMEIWKEFHKSQFLAFQSRNLSLGQVHLHVNLAPKEF